MTHSHDMIIACSSAPGPSVRALIRLTGVGLLDWVHQWSASEIPLRKAFRLELPELEQGHSMQGLPTLALAFRGPRSFTGEDILELQIPGHPVLVGQVEQLLLDRAQEDGVLLRRAEAGEFTQRAYLNGRMDLTQAEGIAATINATTDAQLKAAGILREGRLGDWAGRLVEKLGMLLALVEAGIDFTEEEDVVAISPRDLDQGLEEMLEELEGLLSKSRSWATLDATPWVVLMGLPNAGKSALMNALLGEQRAVISPQAGATRDLLKEPLILRDDLGRPVEVMLVDMAGRDESGTGLNPQMQTQGNEALARAELILMLRNPDQEPLAAPGSDAPVLRLFSQVDRIKEGQGEVADEYPVSAVTGQGLAALKLRMAEMLSDRAVSLSGEMLALQPRHVDDLTMACSELRETRDLLAPDLDERALVELELLALHMRVALDHLSALGGMMTPDDVLGKIFSSFCVGK